MLPICCWLTLLLCHYARFAAAVTRHDAMITRRCLRFAVATLRHAIITADIFALPLIGWLYMLMLMPPHAVAMLSL